MVCGPAVEKWPRRRSSDRSRADCRGGSGRHRGGGGMVAVVVADALPSSSVPRAAFSAWKALRRAAGYTREAQILVPVPPEVAADAVRLADGEPVIAVIMLSAWASVDDFVRFGRLLPKPMRAFGYNVRRPQFAVMVDTGTPPERIAALSRVPRQRDVVDLVSHRRGTYRLSTAKAKPEVLSPQLAWKPQLLAATPTGSRVCHDLPDGRRTRV